MSLIWPRSVVDGLKAWAEKCYPYEGCGVLLGRFEPDGNKRVLRFAPIPNLLHDRDKASPEAIQVAEATLGRRVDSQGQFEFVMDPGAFNRTALDAEKEGLDVVGILHTHPDHPAKPSPTDAAQPLLAMWSNVIVKVDQGRFIEMKAWVREEEKSPFEEEPINLE
jgi:proteasome lid subunit RPN8/RPN11